MSRKKREKKEKPERKKRQKEKVDKPEKIKSDRSRKILRIIIWIILVFIFVRGVIGLIAIPQTEQQRQEIEDYKARITNEANLKTQAVGFAEGFAREYFTHTGENNSDYVSRVSQYTAGGVSITAPGTVKTEAIQVTAIGAEFISKDKIDVDVAVTVEYPDVTKTVAIKVPVTLTDEKCAVVALPQFIPLTDTADIAAEVKVMPGKEVSRTVASEMKPMLENFLETYYSGNENELSYYITKEFPYTGGIEDALQFDSLRTSRITFDSEAGKYYAQINFTVLDEERNLEQMAYLTMTKSGGRYYISDIEAR